MRYKSKYARLALRNDVGTAVYQFENGVLIVGNPALNTAGNVIDETLVQELYPSGTGVQKAGLDKLFWEAPPIAVGAATVPAAGVWYEVISGAVEYDGQTYYKGHRFLSTATTLTADHTGYTGSQFAIAEPLPYYVSDRLDEQDESFVKNNLSSYKDEATWEHNKMQPEPAGDYKWEHGD